MTVGVTTTVFIVGGWSPGPLEYIESHLKRHQKGRPNVVNVKGIPMPPFPGRWCTDRNVLGALVLMILVVLLKEIAMLYVYRSVGEFWEVTMQVTGNILLALILVVWFRWFCALVVRTSIRRGMRIISRYIIKYCDDIDTDTNRIVVVGFSWGGAVVSEMIAQNMLCNSHHGKRTDPFSSAAVLLIAPTTSVVASISNQEDSASRIEKLLRMRREIEARRNSYDCASETKIHVVHGMHDTIFCPNPGRWQGQAQNSDASVKFQILQDSHVFLQRPSKEILVKIIDELVVKQQLELESATLDLVVDKHVVSTR